MHKSNLSQRKPMFLSPEDEDSDRLANGKSQMAGSSQKTFAKRGTVSFNVGRSIPKNIIHDKESLYADNMKLREENKELK